jgi:hypothetical protein
LRRYGTYRGGFIAGYGIGSIDECATDGTYRVRFIVGYGIASINECAIVTIKWFFN